MVEHPIIKRTDRASPWAVTLFVACATFAAGALLLLILSIAGSPVH
jgi:hypothetical protein